jgi:hypothetical protein
MIENFTEKEQRRVKITIEFKVQKIRGQKDAEDAPFGLN